MSAQKSTIRCKKEYKLGPIKETCFWKKVCSEYGIVVDEKKDTLSSLREKCSKNKGFPKINYLLYSTYTNLALLGNYSFVSVMNEMRNYDKKTLKKLYKNMCVENVCKFYIFSITISECRVSGLSFINFKILNSLHKPYLTSLILCTNRLILTLDQSVEIAKIINNLIGVFIKIKEKQYGVSGNEIGINRVVEMINEVVNKCKKVPIAKGNSVFTIAYPFPLRNN